MGPRQAFFDEWGLEGFSLLFLDLPGSSWRGPPPAIQQKRNCHMILKNKQEGRRYRPTQKKWRYLAARCTLRQTCKGATDRLYGVATPALLAAQEQISREEARRSQ